MVARLLGNPMIRAFLSHLPPSAITPMSLDMILSGAGVQAEPTLSSAIIAAVKERTEYSNVLSLLESEDFKPILNILSGGKQSSVELVCECPGCHMLFEVGAASKEA